MSRLIANRKVPNLSQYVYSLFPRISTLHRVPHLSKQSGYSPPQLVYIYYIFMCNISKLPHSPDPAYISNTQGTKQQIKKPKRGNFDIIYIQKITIADTLHVVYKICCYWQQNACEISTKFCGRHC